MVSQRRKWIASLALAWAALVFVFMAAWPVQAAIELAYFRASASINTVLLEWATVSESNISGFVIECKRADEPDSEYHAIGARTALGSPGRGATYSFNVASGLEPGVSYCFRLVETTIDGQPGEQFEICGFGAAITPTPVVIGKLGGFGAVTPSARIVVPPLTDESGFPAATATFIPGAMPVGPTPMFLPTPTFTPVAPVSPQWIPEQPLSPLQSQDTRSSGLDGDMSDNMGEGVTDFGDWEDSGFAGDWLDDELWDDDLWDEESGEPQDLRSLTGAERATIAQQSSQESSQESSPESPPESVETDGLVPAAPATDAAATDATPTDATPTPFQPVSPQPAPTATPTPAIPIPAIPIPAETDAERLAELGQEQDDDAWHEGEDAGTADVVADVGVEATPTPLYRVVTATPTAETLVVAPTFTPWPTVTPEPEFSLVSPFNLSGQNLMIGLLCLIFLTASGLGTLGLVTSVIYMRSRAQREEHLARLYGRRRY